MGFTSAGIGSGLDIESIVAQLVAVEARPTALRLDRKEIGLQVRLSAFGALKGALAALQGSLDKLKDTAGFDTRGATSSDIDVFKVSSDSSATIGSYDITVSQLALSHKLASAAYTNTTDVVGTGTLTFDFGTYDPTETAFTANPDSTSQQVVIDSDNNTLEGVRDAVNDADIGVKATIVNDGSGFKLLFTSESTGAANGLQITVADDDLGNTDATGLSAFTFTTANKNMTTTLAAQDAQFNIDGLSVTKSSNVITDAIEGVTLTLEDAGSARLEVSKDSNAIKNSIRGLVASYNSLLTTLNQASAYNPETKQAGPLIADAAVRTTRSTIQRTLLDRVGALGQNITSFAEIGITTGADGLLKIDDEKLQATLDDNYEQVTTLFSDADNGIASRLGSYLTDLLASDGLLQLKTDTINDQIKGIGKERVALERRLVKIEARYRAQFTAMDMLVAQLNNTSQFLTDQLSRLPKIGANRRG